MKKITSMRRDLVLLLAFLASTLSGLGVASAQNQQDIQIGYVYDFWTSNFVVKGNENRIPVSYHFYNDSFSLKLSTAFVTGDYKGNLQTGDATADFSANNFMDTTVAMNWKFGMGNGWQSSIAGSMYIPTGNTQWETAATSGAIPYVFEPSFYHGRGFGMDLFYSLTTTSSQGEVWGVGMGYLGTTTYATGDTTEATFNPGDTLLGMVLWGTRISDSETAGLRLAHTFPIESIGQVLAANFTNPQATILSGQWLKKAPGINFLLDASFSLYQKGQITYSGNYLLDEPYQFFGNRIEVQPAMTYTLDGATSMETALIWKRVFQNGYPDTDPDFFEGGGNMFGVEQSLSVNLDSNTTWNIAGLYHLISNDKAAQDALHNLTGVDFNRFSIGTNVGMKW